VISGETIAAISSAVGEGARMIVRVSGENSFEIAAKIAGEVAVGARRGILRFAGLEAPGWVYIFRGPHSYTGEDLVEFHVPGNPLLARMLLDDLMKLGARAAEAGEFTARAFFNGKMDLSAAEGVAATIGAQSAAELAAARQLMAGELARRVRPIMERLAEMVGLVEVGIDFSEEEVTFISGEEVVGRAREIREQLERLMGESARLERLSHEPAFVLVGSPNAGKSTLLNALAGASRAVVSAVAGTTRDALSAAVMLDRGIVRVIDVAGLEEISGEGEIEKKMQESARRVLEEAEFVILVKEAGDEREMISVLRGVDLVVNSKGDVSRATDGLLVSAKTGLNMDVLRRRMSEMAFGAATAVAAGLALNGRHVRAIEEAIEAIARVEEAVEGGGAEVVALELREALDALGEILGRVSPDELLGRIFATFCIGK
jgi:tRNA modification GTPase